MISTEEIERRIASSYELPNKVFEAVPEPMVTVRTSTYNHAPYIRQCVEGVLMQQTDFPFEYIIGEDFSTDGTREIIFEYAKRYPEKIRVITSDCNVGVKANGYRCIRASRGKYMALCEGDDYWTDPFKLQKQVDFLESHEDYILCFHDAMTVDENNAVLSYTYPNRLPDGDHPYYSIEDFITNPSNFIPTASIVFRSSDVRKTMKPIPDINLGDIFLIVSLCASTDNNKIKFIDEVMSAYRIHPNGVYKGMGEIDKHLTSIFARIRMSRYFPQYQKMFDLWIERRIRDIIGSNIELRNESCQLSQRLRAKYYPAIKTLARSALSKLLNKIAAK